MKWLSRLFGGKETEISSKSYAIRKGRAVEADESFNAWTSRNLDEMIKAAETDTNPIDRHFLLQTIVDETYKRRDEEKYRDLCIEFSEKHLKEFSEKIVSELKEDFNGVLPRILTFQYYSTLLTELGDFDRAIKVCETAISFGLHDGTKSGFQGRIDRIKKKMNSSKT